MGMTRNRLTQTQPDYLLMIVHRPRDWCPTHLADAPIGAEPISTALVASFEEAHDDLVRCNRLAIKHRLNQWAVIESTRRAT